MIRVTLFTRANCSLCDRAGEDLQALQAQVPHELVVVDIDQDPDLKRAFDERVPVVQAGPYTLDAPFDRRKLQATLSAAHDRHQQKQDDERYQERLQRGQQLSRADRFTYWISNHYLAVICLMLAIYVGLPFLAPVLMKAGYPGLARPIYSAYGAVCHQLGFRSWFLYGDQVVYPREDAHVEGLETFGEATGLDEDDILAARDYIGDEEVGYKVAYCQRDTSIYGSILLFALLFGLTGRRLKSIPWYLWIGIGILPMALDGGSQLLSQIPGFPFWAYRESTPLMRAITGALFGFTTGWFGIPMVEEAMADARLLVASKMARLKRQAG